MCLGIPGQIVEVTDAVRKLAVVEVGGVKRTVNIACIVNEERSDASCLGDWVLVHVGFCDDPHRRSRGRAHAGLVDRDGRSAGRAGRDA